MNFTKIRPLSAGLADSDEIEANGIPAHASAHGRRTGKTRRTAASAIAIVAALGIATAMPANGQDVQAAPVYSGGLSLSRPNTTLMPGLAIPGWKFFRPSVGAGACTDADGWRTFSINAGSAVDSPVLKGRARFLKEDGASGTSGAALRAEWRLVPTADIALMESFVDFVLDGADIADGSAVLDGRPLPILLDGRKRHLFRNAVSCASFLDSRGAEMLRLAFDRPTRILVQDEAFVGNDNLTVRVFFAEGPVACGREYAIAARISTPAFGQLALLKSGVHTIGPGPDWIPIAGDPWIEPGSALDFTQVVPRHAPAGVFGRVVAVGDHFEFEGLPGIPQRFLGANLCSEGNLPSTREAADRLAAQLSRVGYNAIRLHHHDRYLVTASGNRTGDDAGIDDTVPDPALLTRFDNLVAACKENGIYITTDLFVSRSHLVTWRSIGIDRDGCIEDHSDYKLLCAFWEPAYSNLLSWSRNFLGHVNPRTGLSLAEDPVLATLALINEGNLGNWNAGRLRAIPGIREAWGKWLASKQGEAPQGDDPFAGIPPTIPDTFYANGGDTPEKRHAAAFAIFLAETEIRLADRLRAFVRDELHCQSPISSLSAWYHPVQYQLVRARCLDYVDNHFYVDHPNFLVKPWSLPSYCHNVNPMLGKSAGAQTTVFRRLMDKPFCITEWNYSGPGRYRGVGGIAAGALGALQDWSGMWRFAWSHGLAGVETPEKKPMRYFDLSGDPLALASERAACCLFLRGDMPTLPAEYPVALDPDALRDPRNGAPRCENGRWVWAAWNARLGTTVQRPAGGHALDTPVAQVRADLAALGADKPGNGAVSIDSTTGTFLIDTPRTAGGFAEAGAHEAGPLRFTLAARENSRRSAESAEEDLDLSCVDIGEQFEFVNNSPATPATVWASSLDGEPIAKSSRILVTHLTDVQDTGIRYADPGRTILLEWGRLPHLMRNGRAEVELTLQGDAGNCPPQVFRLSQSGLRLGTVPADWDTATGRLAFTARTDYDPASASFLYEIVREPPSAASTDTQNSP